MTDLSMVEIFKMLSPILPVIVSIIALKSGWVYKRDKVFNSRKAYSEFAYNMYKNTSDENFKRISIEYGISAITKDSNLTPEQRRILLHSKDPVRDIDNYSKCQKLLKIGNEVNVFTWSNKLYRFWIWRKLVETISLILYFANAAVVALPFFYTMLPNSHMIEKINSLTLIAKCGLAAYCVVTGGGVAMFFLNKISTIHLAEKTIITNRKST